MKHTTFLWAAAASVAITSLSAGAAFADADGGSVSREKSATSDTAQTAATTVPPNRLHVDTYTCDFATSGVCDYATNGAFGKWVKFPANGNDSPLDSNSKALVVHTPSADPAAQNYTEVYSAASLNINKPVEQIKNLSFDAFAASLRGGSPRINVFFASTLTDGSSYVAIDAGNCQQALSSTWVRADATGRKAAGCTIYTSAGTAYTSDGTNSAWANFVAANPGTVVSYTFMVFDIPTGSDTLGDYRVDRIALGTARFYNESNYAVNCYSEGAC